MARQRALFNLKRKQKFGKSSQACGGSSPYIYIDVYARTDIRRARQEKNGIVNTKEQALPCYWKKTQTTTIRALTKQSLNHPRRIFLLPEIQRELVRQVQLLVQRPAVQQRVDRGLQDQPCRHRQDGLVLLADIGDNHVQTKLPSTNQPSPFFVYFPPKDSFCPSDYVAMQRRARFIRQKYISSLAIFSRLHPKRPRSLYFIREGQRI
jgi:hypothetical protein